MLKKIYAMWADAEVPQGANIPLSKTLETMPISGEDFSRFWHDQKQTIVPGSPVFIMASDAEEKLDMMNACLEHIEALLKEHYVAMQKERTAAALQKQFSIETYCIQCGENKEHAPDYPLAPHQ